MSLPKDKVREIFEPVVLALLEPSERVDVAAYVVPGPSPMAVGFLGAVLQSLRGRGDLWMAVTDRRVIFIRATLMTQKPKGFAWADQRHSVEIAEIHSEERSGWHWFIYSRQDGEPLRLNFSVLWEEEFAAVARELSSPTPPPALEDWE